MEITILVQSIVGLVIILSILVFLLSGPFEKKPKKEIKVNKKPSPLVIPKTDMESLRAIVANPESSVKELADALSLVIKYHGTMHIKLGMNAHPDSNIYMDALFKVCRHKNANKEMIVKFNNELEKLNPQYKREINDALMRGLNSRGV
ncbi:MAG: hypothetical protein QM497_00440 [Sulfurimonas sp.]